MIFNKIMKLFWLVHPRHKVPDTMLTFVAFTVMVCGIKFLFEGIQISYMELSFTLGHSDPLTYGAMLAPILGAHGYIRKTKDLAEKGTGNVDNPDGGK